jgi:hypothetical protein
MRDPDSTADYAKVWAHPRYAGIHPGMQIEQQKAALEMSEIFCAQKVRRNPDRQREWCKI